MGNKPSYSILISSRAQKELEDAWNWYEDRQAGLGDRFIKELYEKSEK